MCSKVAVCCLFAALIVGCVKEPQAPSPGPIQAVIVTGISQDHLTYYTYERKGPINVDLSDLNVSSSVIAETDPFGQQFDSPPDFKLLLIQRGWATLKDPSHATQQYRAAQSQAEQEQQASEKARKEQEQRSQIEKAQEAAQQKAAEEAEQRKLQEEEQKRAQGPSTAERLWDKLSSLFSAALASVSVVLIRFLHWLRSIWLWIVSIGLASIFANKIISLFTRLYHRIRFERRIRLLFIGLSSTGKSAIKTRLVNPDISREEILNPSENRPTSELRTDRRNECVRADGFMIFPECRDVPGSEYSAVWDELAKTARWRYHTGLVVPLSLTGSDRLNTSRTWDENYIESQLVYIQFVAGFLKSHIYPKPKIVIIFLAKFDLLSERSPNDKSSQGEKANLEERFRAHIDIIRDACVKNDIPFETIVGSAAANWNVEQIVKVVGRRLYARKPLRRK